MLCLEVPWMPHLDSKSPKLLIWLADICIGVSCLMILLEMLEVGDCGCSGCYFFFFLRKFSRPLHFSNSVYDFYLYFCLEK